MLLDGILVATGGAIGSLLRYMIGLALPPWDSSGLPIGTLVVNLVGSLVIGFVLGWGDAPQPNHSTSIRLLLTTGFCGGFTTFSTFSWEGMRLLSAGQGYIYVLYVILTLLLGLLAVYLGYLCARTLH